MGLRLSARQDARENSRDSSAGNKRDAELIDRAKGCRPSSCRCRWSDGNVCGSSGNNRMGDVKIGSRAKNVSKVAMIWECASLIWVVIVWCFECGLYWKITHIQWFSGLINRCSIINIHYKRFERMLETDFFMPFTFRFDTLK